VPTTLQEIWTGPNALAPAHDGAGAGEMSQLGALKEGVETRAGTLLSTVT